MDYITKSSAHHFNLLSDGLIVKRLVHDLPRDSCAKNRSRDSALKDGVSI